MLIAQRYTALEISLEDELIELVQELLFSDRGGSTHIENTLNTKSCAHEGDE